MSIHYKTTARGRKQAVVSGHWAATAAAWRLLERGGNAIDAAAAAHFCLIQVEPHHCGLGGEVPILYYDARDRQVHAICGQGWSPAALTLEFCRREGLALIPGDGLLPACVPAVVGTWASAMARFGTLGWAEVLAPAIELAEEGVVVDPVLREALITHRENIAAKYPSTFALYYPDGEPPAVGESLPNPDLARTLAAIVGAEGAALARGRVPGILAGCDAFYSGPIARRILEFVHETEVADGTGQSHRGVLAAEDLTLWRATIEPPVSIEFRGLRVHKCPPWSQGPVFLQQLRLLEGFDLAALGAERRLHVQIECAKLAFADREAWYGDPAHGPVPLDELFSPVYAAARRQLVGEEASLALRPGSVAGWVPPCPPATDQTAVGDLLHAGDTTHLDVADRFGNMLAATPSGGWIRSSPVIPGLGFALGTRAQMFDLDERRPNGLAPRKRPRTTLSPSLVTRGRDPMLAFGTRGGDSQDQWTLQFFLHFVVDGMSLHEALDAPHWHSLHAPASFWPREAKPGLVRIDESFDAALLEALEARGHRLDRHDFAPDINQMAIHHDPKRGTLAAAACSLAQCSQALAW